MGPAAPNALNYENAGPQSPPVPFICGACGDEPTVVLLDDGHHVTRGGDSVNILALQG